jgi:hypothetical protein
VTFAIAAAIAIAVGVLTIGVAAFSSLLSSSLLLPLLPLPPSMPSLPSLFTISGHYE